LLGLEGPRYDVERLFNPDGEGHVTNLGAPIEASKLQRVLARATGASRTLPAEAYLSAEVFDWEQAWFFEGSWTCVGRADDLDAPGDQKAVRIGQEGVLLVRDRGGDLRGFYNVCRHRGHELVEPGTSRNLRAIKCPYHAWVYSLEGALAGAPRFGEAPGFDKADYPLVQVRVAEWHGWIFADASGDAPDFIDHVGNLDGLLAPWEPERLSAAARHEYVVRANWKGIVENYHECYHCPSIHPALCKVTPTDSGESFAPTGCWVGGSMELEDHAETMSLSGASGGVPIRGLDAKQRREVYYFGLFPNLLIGLHPDYVMAHRLEPIGPGETFIECTWLFPPEAGERVGFDPAYAAEFWDITNREDWAACESVQRGLASRGQRQGPFAEGEDEVHAFMAIVARGYLEGRIAAPASAPTSAAVS
jgi:phenylpropionate dioxygenase-like ring-hydroxylating dioxygenase large terminal subunit